MSGLIRRWLIPSVLALAAAASDARAHTRSISYSIWTWDGDEARVDLRIPRDAAAELVVGAGLERGRIGPSQVERMRSALPGYVAAHLEARRGGKVCRCLPGDGRAILGGDWFFVRLDVTCERAGPLSLRSTLFEGVNPTHVHLARMTGTEPDRELVLGGLRPSSATGAPDGGEPPRSFFALGVEHILTGYDHLAFLAVIMLALLDRSLARARLARVLWAIGAFTVGHSATLVVAVLGGFSASPSGVEVLIALSVAATAIAGCCSGREGRAARVLPPAGLAMLCALPVVAAPAHAIAVLGMLAFGVAYQVLVTRASSQAPVHAVAAGLFGLIHGLAFAGTLAGLNLPPERVTWPLFQFNVGVEVGQVAAVAVAVAPLALVFRVTRRAAWAPAALHGAIFVLAAYWVGARAG